MYVAASPPPSTTFVHVTSTPDEAPNVGEMLVFEYIGRKGNEKEHLYRALGFVVGSVIKDENVLDPQNPRFIGSYKPENAYVSSPVYLIGEISQGFIEPLKVPPMPGKPTKVRRARKEDLENLFERGESSVEIGSVINIPELRVPISIQEIATKHLAVLAITGAGKSNTVARILTAVLESDLVLPMVVFDIHGEYYFSGFTRDQVERLEPKIDLRKFSEDSAATLLNIPESAYLERGAFYEARNAAMNLDALFREHFNRTLSAKGFISLLSGILVGMLADIAANMSKNSQKKYVSKLTSLFKRYGFKLLKHRLPLEPYVLGAYFTTKKLSVGDNLTDSDYLPATLGLKELREGESISFSVDLPHDLSVFSNDLDELKETFKKIVAKYDAPAYIYSKPSDEFTRVQNIIRKLYDFLKTFGDIVGDSLQLSEFVRLAKLEGRAKVFVLDFSRYPISKADILIAAYMRELFEMAREEARKALMENRTPEVNALMVLEEAHNFIGDKVEGHTKSVAERILREGRKYGLGMVIVTQRPRRLDTNIMSQVNNYVILKIVHPEDQNYVKSLTESLPDELARHLSDLRTGEALLVGPFVKFPIIIKVDKEPRKRAGITPVVPKKKAEEFDELEYYRSRTPLNVFLRDQ